MEVHCSEGDMVHIKLDFRPAGYFWPLDLAVHLLATVKGTERRKYIQSLISALGMIRTAPPQARQVSMSMLPKAPTVGERPFQASPPGAYFWCAQVIDARP